MRIKIGSVRHVPERLGKTVAIQNTKIALFRTTDGCVYAIENRCPHKGGDLSQGILCEEFVYCPYHDWKISVKDGIVQAPDQGCVKTFPVEIENGTIYIQFDELGESQ